MPCVVLPLAMPIVVAGQLVACASGEHCFGLRPGGRGAAGLTARARCRTRKDGPYQADSEAAQSPPGAHIAEHEHARPHPPTHI